MDIMPWTGSKNDYSNIVFTRKFHPPYSNYIVNADWDDHEKLITIYLPSFKYFGENNNRKAPREIMRLFNHETLHGVILAIQWSDKVPQDEIGDSEFPLNNGMDPYLSKQPKCNHCKSIVH